MTIEEAIDILTDNRVFTHACGYTEEEQGQALDMAIQSLEAWSEVRKCVIFHKFDKLSEEELTGFQGFILERLQEVENADSD